MPTNPAPSRATIEDVAAAAGVSVATVSRALRGLPNVALSTRTHVASVAESMSYRADPAASRLAKGRSRTVAIAVPVLGGWYFSQVIAGAEAVLAEAGYDLLIIGVAGEAERIRLLDAGQTIAWRVDGLILVDIAITAEEASDLASRRTQVVTIGAFTAGFPAIRIDDRLVGQLATEHLLGLGHRRIALIGGQGEYPLYFDPPLLRRTGYEQALAAAGIAADAALFAEGNFSIEGGHEAMNQLLDLAEPPTAVFAMSDEMAFGALMAARLHGLTVPGDLSIVGVDGHEFSQVVGLTTVSQPVTHHGSQAARLMLESLGLATAPHDALAAGHLVDDAFGVHVHDIELIVRDTSAAPREH